MLGRSRVQTSCHRVDRHTTVSTAVGHAPARSKIRHAPCPELRSTAWNIHQQIGQLNHKSRMISSLVPGTLSRTLAGVEDDGVDARFGMQPPNALLVLVPRAHCRAHPQLPAPGQALETNDCHAVREMSPG